jgi:hypothetical protein
VDNTKLELKETGCEAMDRVKWQAFVTAIMNAGVPLKVRILLTS